MSHLTTHKHRECSYLRAYKAPVNCPRSSTSVENALQISSFMQNKANLLDAQMNVSTILKREYENIANWKLGENKPNTNPIKPNFLRDKTNANLFVEKDYENKPRFRVLTKQTQTNPILTVVRQVSNATTVFPVVRLLAQFLLDYAVSAV